MRRLVGQLKLPVRINLETLTSTLQSFTDYFKGFEKVKAVRDVFGENTDVILQNLKIGFVSYRRMYMGIRDEDGNISIGTYHLKHSDLRTLYLDVVHELFHVKQFMENKEYFREEHKKFMLDRSLYYLSPIEVPAYNHTVREAERIGMSNDEIINYLKMGPVPPRIFNKFLEEMGLKREATSSPASRAKLFVRINRNPSLTLLPFTNCFEGFEKIPTVKALFGDRTEEVLSKLRVEFVDTALGTIFPSEEDGHLVISVAYLRKGDVNSIYLGVLLCLNFLKHLSEGKIPFDSRDREFWENPVILESYKAMVREARRIGTSNDKILEHLQIPRFIMSPRDYNRFVRKLLDQNG